MDALKEITLSRPTVKNGSEQDRDTFDPTHDIDLYCDQASGLVNIAIMDGTVWRLLNGLSCSAKNWIPVAAQIHNSKRQ
ncbi:phage major head protein [Escherichia coli]|uniref:Phage major head protein n=1 Tax=Escherichia coli TaxID=562 RepID=A0A2X3JKG3_ECOLX|nr:phage major head protein [Escherichia coli]